MSYEIINVDNWLDVSEKYPNYIGEREKVWLQNPANNVVAMFKIPRKNRGEHWAEKLCWEFAKIIGIPCAKVDLANFKGVCGTLSYYFLDISRGDIHTDSGSFFEYDFDEKGKIADYYIEALEDKFEEYKLSELFLDIIQILVFDALIGNGDRHQDNWGITQYEILGEEQIKISPLYDNSASLARDQAIERVGKLISSDQEMLTFINKGKAKIGYKDYKNVNHFTLIRYLLNKYPKRTKEVIDNIKNELSNDKIRHILEQMPKEILNEKTSQMVGNYVINRKEKLIRMGETMIYDTNKLLVVWKSPTSRCRHVVGKLEYKKDEVKKYTFKYVSEEKLETAIKDGFKGFPIFKDFKRIYENEQLFKHIESRLPNRRRSDYAEILKRYGLTNDNTDMEVLQATRGRLATDNFEFLIPTNYEVSKKIEIVIDVAGLRYFQYEGVKKELMVGDQVQLQKESENNKDEFAVLVIYKDGIKLGYVPRVYAKEVTAMLDDNIDYIATISKLCPESENQDEWISVEITSKS